MMHPLAIKNDNGANGMKSGDRIIYIIDGRTGVADEFLHDGDAFVTFDDGQCETVKWHHLRKCDDIVEQLKKLGCEVSRRAARG